MTLEQLQVIFPSATEATWHQHNNGGGWVENTTEVAESAFIAETAQVYGDARVYGDAWVYGDAQVYSDAQVYGDAWAQSPLYIQGTKHRLCMCSQTLLAIGCIEKPIVEWLETYGEVGRVEGYSSEQVEEYFDYIQLFARRYPTEVSVG